jgi:uncharacterized Zn-binding protein involved in type VI secretion
MSKVARIGDSCSVICSVHGARTATIITGSTDVFNGVGIARKGDTVRATCGHTGIITSGSATVFVNGKEVARVGDTIGDGTLTSGTIVSGSSTIEVG